MQNDSKRTPGRPTGKPDNRSRILSIARQQFSNSGYDRTTIRSVASEAAIDPTLVIHYFSSKHKLFMEAMLPTYRPPVNIKNFLGGVAHELMGARLAKFVCSIMEDVEGRSIFVGLLRAASSDAEVAKNLRVFIEEGLLAQLKQSLTVKESDFRVMLINSQIIGLFVSRYITKIEPLASMDLSDLERQLTPYFQTYIESM